MSRNQRIQLKSKVSKHMSKKIIYCSIFIFLCILIPLKAQADGMTKEDAKKRELKKIQQEKNKKRFGLIQNDEKIRSSSSFYCDIENLIEYNEILYSGNDELCNQFIKGNEKKYKFGEWKKSKVPQGPPNYWTSVDLFGDGKEFTLTSYCIKPYKGERSPFKQINIWALSGKNFEKKFQTPVNYPVKGVNKKFFDDPRGYHYDRIWLKPYSTSILGKKITKFGVIDVFILEKYPEIKNKTKWAEHMSISRYYWSTLIFYKGKPYFLLRKLFPSINEIHSVLFEYKGYGKKKDVCYFN